MERTPVFISNSALARFFKDVPEPVREKCLLLFGSKQNEIFGKAGAEYDEFLRRKQQDGKLFTLKPPNWRAGLPCDFALASEFLQSNGFNAMSLDMDFYRDNLDLQAVLPEARRHIQNDKDRALRQIRENFQEAVDGNGNFGHDYGPVLVMLEMADPKLFPIFGSAGVKEFMEKARNEAVPEVDGANADGNPMVPKGTLW
jgi:hypothetical protein